MDLDKYFDQTKNLIDFYIKISDYQKAFMLLLNSLDQIDEDYMKKFIKHYKEKQMINIDNKREENINKKIETTIIQNFYNYIFVLIY